jgi:hypothetical protein
MCSHDKLSEAITSTGACAFMMQTVENVVAMAEWGGFAMHPKAALTID